MVNDNLLNFIACITIGKKADLNDFECNMVIGVRRIRFEY